MPDTIFEGVLNKLILCLILALASPSAASDLVSATHFFPVVSRTDGLAGTRWSTAVQIANPQTEDLTITAWLSMGGALQSETFVVSAGETASWQDFLAEVFDAVGNGALLLDADADANQNLPAERRGFAASMRIFTEGFGGGSFGQGVPSLDPVTGFLGDWIATFPAVVLWGRPGEGGFRTNVGFWNIGTDDAQLRLRILDTSGAQVWQQFVTVYRDDPMVMSLPRELGLPAATLVVDSLGEWLDCAVYISVVDNITGDATYLGSQLMDPGAAAAGGGAAGGTEGVGVPERSAARMRALALGGSR